MAFPDKFRALRTSYCTILTVAIFIDVRTPRISFAGLATIYLPNLSICTRTEVYNLTLATLAHPPTLLHSPTIIIAIVGFHRPRGTRGARHSIPLPVLSLVAHRLLGRSVVG